MGSDAGKRIGAVGRRDMWIVEAETLYSPRSDPKHEEHENWLSRTDPSDPEMVALMASMRENGTDEGMPILVYTEDGRKCVAAGDRRMAACILVNKERKGRKQPPLVLRALTTKDPVAARSLENACRRDDPPLVLARRYRSNAATMGDAPAAAACGLTLGYANALLRCLSLPADLQAKVNSRELPPDVALRLAKGGTEAARAAVAEATDANGKVDGRKARAAAKAVEKRPRPRAAVVLASVESELRIMTADAPVDAHPESPAARMRDAADVLAWARGGAEPPAWLKKWVESAEATRKGARAVKKGASADDAPSSVPDHALAASSGGML